MKPRPQRHHLSSLRDAEVPVGTPPALTPTTPEQLHVMSMNIRYDRSVDGGTRPSDPDHWPERRPLLIELLARERPDLLGVQEALHGQLSALDEALPGHRRLGYGREGGSHGEHAVILYDPERFEVIAWDQFWLSAGDRFGHLGAHRHPDRGPRRPP